MNLAHIWLLCLTIFVAAQQVGDLRRWSQVGAAIRAQSEAIAAISGTQKSQLEYNQTNTEVVKLIVAHQLRQPQ